MNSAEFPHVLKLAEQLIAIPSVTGEEKAVLDFIRKEFSAWGWNVETLPVAENRYDILATFGTPRVVFTTHVDVVPAPAKLFQPHQAGGCLFGRGSCDAKGIAAAMIGACARLRSQGAKDFAVLLVIGEEKDGIGARTAAAQLQGRGIKYIINGEPTERKMMLAHKGSVRVRVNCSGRAAHSGYPHHGEDANRKLVRIANRLINADFGSDPVLGSSTLNLGVIRGGVASNVISPAAHLEANLRIVGDEQAALRRVTELVGEEGTITETSVMPVVRLKTLPGFETDVAAYGTDVPYFFPLTIECFLFGPGSIAVAHSENENIPLEDLEKSVDDYCRIFAALGN